MSDEKKKVNSAEVEEIESKEVSLDNLDEVAGGGAFSNIPRVPTKQIDDKVRENI